MALPGISVVGFVVRREAWPRGRRVASHLLAGAFLNGFYLCLSWWAVLRGMPSGIMALLGALQPLVVAFASVGSGSPGPRPGCRSERFCCSSE